MYPRSEIEHTKIIEKSRFIAYLLPCFSEEEYKETLKLIKKKYYDASHVCSAFICDNIKRSSDDGEPSGTAGVPILSTLEKNNCNQCAAYVVRYFGGIKLGTGGLVRAYGSVVSEAIEKGPFVQEVELPYYELTLSYELANKVDYLLTKESFHLEKEYETEVTFKYLSDNSQLVLKIQEICGGITPKCCGTKTIQKDI